MDRKPWRENPPKPQKRHPALHPFSHEHHQGLVISLRLYHGGKEGTDIEILRSYILGFWEDQLKDHFKREEEILGKYADHNHQNYQQFLAEHRSIRSDIENIRTGEFSKGMDYHYFGKKLRDHIRFEERKFFPWLQQDLNEDQLRYVAKELEGIREKCYHFTPPFWLDNH